MSNGLPARPVGRPELHLTPTRSDSRSAKHSSGVPPMSTSSVQQVEAFQTTDGQVFLEEDAAHSHQARLDLQTVVESVDWPDFTKAKTDEYYRLWTGWLLKHAKEIEKIQRLLEVAE